MINFLKDKIANCSSSIEKYNLLREELQLIILNIADDIGLFNHIAFVGDTALRILYGLKRFSEDLDFSLINKKNFCFETALIKLCQRLNTMNIPTELKLKPNNTVAVAFIKFNYLLNELNLAEHKDQKLLIKFELDQNPPQGFNTELSVLNSSHFFTINHFDKPSLFSGKLHAILCRGHVKGRDYYDFIWYINQKISPNYNLLNHSLEQTNSKLTVVTEQNIIELLSNKFQTTNYDLVKKDIKPFLQNPNELKLFTKEIFMQLIRQFQV